jgi:hypothetical protein
MASNKKNRNGKATVSIHPSGPMHPDVHLHCHLSSSLPITPQFVKGKFP